MPLGAANLNLLGKYFPAAPAGRTAKTLSAYGNAQVDTAQSKFGGASALFDGASDAIKVTTGLSDFEGSGDFTYEFWIRSSNIGGRFAVVDQRHTNNSALTFNIFFWDGALQMYQNGFASLGGTWSNNTWYHVAVTKSGSTYKGYQNGTLTGTWSSGASTIATVGEMNIALANDEVNWDFSGHLDEIRVSDTVRYTSNFTAPSGPFSNDSNTLLLIHCNGTDGSTTFTDDNT